MPPPRASVRLRPVGSEPLRAVAYLRQSVAREESISLELQETACRDYAVRQGYQLVDVIADPGVSGLKWEHRPGVQRVMAAVQAGDVDVVLVWRWSRLSRSRLHQALALDAIERAGARVESALEPFDTTSAGGEFGRDVMLAAAHFESRQKSEQWREAQKRRIGQGLPHGGGARFGYTYSREGYVPDPESGALLRSLYEQYVAGLGFQQLCVSLNRAGVATLRGGMWTATTLLRQLDSGFGAGFLRVGVRAGSPEYLPGSHEPVIGENLWQAYLARRDEQRLRPARARRPVYPLTGLVKHADCGAALVSWSKPDRSGVVRRGYLYRCSAWAAGACPGLWVKRETVEREVLRLVAEWASDVDTTAATKTAREASRALAKADRTRLHREQTRLSRALANLTVQVASGLVPESAYRDARDELVAQQADVDKQLAALAVEERSLGVPMAQLRSLLGRWDTLPPSGRRDLLADFVARVDVSRDAAGGVVVGVVPVGGVS